MKICCLKPLNILLLIILYSGSAICQNTSESKASIDVMLLGVYHFDNPGQDKHNLHIDDYFSGRRQKEINEVVDMLAQFTPEKIFIEQKPSSQNRIDSLYQAYIHNKLNLKDLERGRNEISAWF